MKMASIQEPQDVFNPSNSIEHEEVVLMTHGFRPDFNTKENKFNQVPKRTMNTRRFDKKKNGKRVLKRI